MRRYLNVNLSWGSVSGLLIGGSVSKNLKMMGAM